MIILMMVVIVITMVMVVMGDDADVDEGMTVMILTTISTMMT